MDAVAAGGAVTTARSEAGGKVASELVVQYYNWAIGLRNSYLFRRAYRYLGEQELVADILYGLVCAANKFTSIRGSFRTYACFCIYTSVYDHIRELRKTEKYLKGSVSLAIVKDNISYQDSNKFSDVIFDLKELISGEQLSSDELAVVNAAENLKAGESMMKAAGIPWRRLKAARESLARKLGLQAEFGERRKKKKGGHRIKRAFMRRRCKIIKKSC
jgi:hypothetical protein